MGKHQDLGRNNVPIQAFPSRNINMKNQANQEKQRADTKNEFMSMMEEYDTEYENIVTSSKPVRQDTNAHIKLDIPPTSLRPP